MCQIYRRGDDDFDIWSTLLCPPFKCSNLVPKSMKSNEQLNRGTRLVENVNTWLFIHLLNMLAHEIDVL
jgi:hypothetical protein